MVHRLAAVDVFKGLGDKELKLLVECAQEAVYPLNKIIFREGEAGDKMYVIMEGIVEIWKSDGRELKGSRLARLKNNEIFGEMAIFDNEPRSATAYAVVNDETKILLWEGKDVTKLIEENPVLGVRLLFNILHKQNNRLRTANDAVHTLLRANRYIGM